MTFQLWSCSQARWLLSCCWRSCHGGHVSTIWQRWLLLVLSSGSGSPYQKKKKKPTQQNLRAALSTSFSDPTWNISLFILVEFVYLFSPISVFLSLIFDNSTTICTLLKAGFSPGFIIGLSRETPQSTWRNNLPRN